MIIDKNIKLPDSGEYKYTEPGKWNRELTIKDKEE